MEALVGGHVPAPMWSAGNRKWWCKHASPRDTGSLCLATEKSNLTAVGLPQNVNDKIKSARARPTRSQYKYNWGWGQQGFNRKKGKAFSTWKVNLPAILACHMGFDDHIVGQQPLVCRFMKGVQRKLPSVRSLAPSWDLPTVLEAISQAPFEPLEQVDMKMVSLKMAWVIALTSAERVREMHTLSVNNACRQISPNGLSVRLKFWMMNDSMSGLYIGEGWWPLQCTRHQSQRNVIKSFCSGHARALPIGRQLLLLLREPRFCK